MRDPSERVHDILDPSRPAGPKTDALGRALKPGEEGNSENTLHHALPQLHLTACYRSEDKVS